MAQPKRKHSKQRYRTRRSAQKLSPANLSECSNCHAKRPSHQVCPECGYYKGRQVFSVD